jgi:Tfp pilus assembly protein PilN
MAARRPNIDLLSREDFAQRAVGRVLLWILTVGRYIVIFTELIVIAGFITRVVLDRNLSSVNEVLVEQKAILASYQPVENRFRRVHQQLDSYSQMDADRLDVSKLLDDLIQTIPTNMQFESLTIDKNREAMDVTAVVLSPASFSVFLSKLQAMPELDDLILESVEIGSAQDPSIKFRLSVEFKTKVIPKGTPARKVTEKDVL